MPGGKLTPKQERFCKEYVIDLNATQAAIRAGYSANCAEVTGSNLLRNPKVLEKLSQLRQEQEKRLDISADAVLQRLAHIGFSDPADLEGFRGSDVVKSLELLGKHKGIFVDRTEISGPGGGPVATIDVSRLTDEQLAVMQEVASLQHDSPSS